MHILDRSARASLKWSSYSQFKPGISAFTLSQLFNTGMVLYERNLQERPILLFGGFGGIGPEYAE